MRARLRAVPAWLMSRLMDKMLPKGVKAITQCAVDYEKREAETWAAEAAASTNAEVIA